MLLAVFLRIRLKEDWADRDVGRMAAKSPGKWAGNLSKHRVLCKGANMPRRCFLTAKKNTLQRIGYGARGAAKWSCSQKNSRGCWRLDDVMDLHVGVADDEILFCFYIAELLHVCGSQMLVQRLPGCPLLVIQEIGFVFGGGVKGIEQAPVLLAGGCNARLGGLDESFPLSGFGGDLGGNDDHGILSMNGTGTVPAMRRFAADGP